MSKVSLPHTPKWSREYIEDILSKRYFKKPYDRFMWWRSYTLKNKPLPPRYSTLKDRIINGDFDYGPYLYEVELARHTINDKFLQNIGSNGQPDYGKFHSETSIDRARIKRLLEDSEKDEFGKLRDLKTGFLHTFKITREQYEEEVLESGADSIIDFYFEIEDKYGKYAIPPKKVPKF